MTLQVQTYTRNLAKTNEENMFLLPWGGMVLRNCDGLGDLLLITEIVINLFG
jgi:hypothetical protein